MTDSLVPSIHAVAAQAESAHREIGLDALLRRWAFNWHESSCSIAFVTALLPKIHHFYLNAE